MALTILLNGAEHPLEALDEGADLSSVIAALDLKSDRVAVEWNGVIARRNSWGEVRVRSGDKLEVVHFVGGGKR